MLVDQVKTYVIMEKSEVLLDVRKEASVEDVYAQKAKYVFMFCHKKAAQNYDIKVASKSFENVVRFRYLGLTVTCKNCFLKELRVD
jgi:hypothetical protein